MKKKQGNNIFIRGGILKNSFLNKRKEDPEVEKIIVERGFDFDDDLAPHFAEYPNLKEFEVREINSRFVSYDGLLYMRLGEEVLGSNIASYCGYFDWENGGPNKITNGLVLLCCPQSIKQKDIVIHENCTVIYGSAFYGCKLNSITIPKGLMMTCPASFTNVTINKLIVPSRNDIRLNMNHCNVNKDVMVQCIDKDNPSYEDICSFWKAVITGENTFN